MNLLETRGLEFSYGNHKILDGLDLQVPEGSIYGFLGKNGAGKSTTIKIVLGLIKASKGKVYLRGQDLKDNKVLLNNMIGSLVESPAFYSHLSAYENLKYLDIIFNKGEKRIQRVLELVGLAKDQNTTTRNFSTGMKQRLGIAIAVYHEPEVLVLDEPFNGLDPEGIYEMRQLILNLNSEGKTIFVSSHILADIEKLSTHIGILDNKKFIFQGKIEQLLSTLSRQVFLNVNNLEKAASLCANDYITATIVKNKFLSTYIEDDQAFNKLIYMLVQNEIEIYSVDTRQNSLETVYLKLIKEK